MDFDAVFKEASTGVPAQVETPPPAPPEAPPAPPVAPPEAPPAAPAEQPAPQDAPLRDDKGKFAPISALQEERVKRQELQRRLDDLEAAQRKPAAPEAPQAIPDPYDDPAGFQAYNNAQIANGHLAIRFELSELMARKNHSDVTVTAAMEWGSKQAQANPGFRQDFLSQKDPIDWVIQQRKREDLLLAVGSDDEEAFVRRRAAELGLIAVPDAGAGVVSAPEAQAPRPAAPPRSIASAPSAGGSVRDVPTGPLAGVGAAFSR